MAYNVWSEQEVQRLLVLLREKYQAKDIARILGRSVQAVKLKIQHMKNKSKVERKIVNITDRTCLRCHKTFSSRGAGNRLCGRCNDTNASLYDPQYNLGCQ